MGRIKLGNVKGPPGEPGRTVEGPRGKQGQRGNRIVFGTAITGTSMEEKSYPTGIADSIQYDVYWNEDTCNIYTCTVSGDETTAKWTYIGNSKGTETVVKNLLNSQSIKDALSANCGYRLLENITMSDSNPSEIHLEDITGVKILKMYVTPGVPTVFVFQDDNGIEYTSEILTADPMKNEQLLLKTTDLGMPSDVIIRKIISNGGKIRRLTAETETGIVLFESKPVEQLVFELEKENLLLKSKYNELEVKMNKQPTFYYGTGDPDDTLGKDGDIYLKIEG